MALSGALGPDTVLPTSILIDANGKEVWRYVGDLDWTSPEAAKLLVGSRRFVAKQAEQPAVDRREAERDQAKAEEILRRERLVEEQRAEQDRDRRDQQRHEQGVGRAGCLDQPEVEHVAERGAEQSQRNDRAPGGDRREGVGPGLSMNIDIGSMISAPAVSWPVVTLSGEMPWRRKRRAHTAARA